MNLLDKIKNIWPFDQSHKMRAIGFERPLINLINRMLLWKKLFPDHNRIKMN